MNSGAELFLFAGPEMGHIVAEVELGRRLTSLDPQISITILIPKLPVPNKNLDAFIHSLDADLRRDSDQRISIVDLPRLDDVPPELTQPGNHIVLIDALTSHYKPIVKRVVEDRRKRRRTAGIVFDMFCAPMVDVAEELGVPSYLFYTSNATVLSLTLYLGSLGADVDLPALFDGMSPESTPVKLPGIMNPLPVKVWPEPFISKEMALSGHFVRFASMYRKARGILVNTFSELEPNRFQSPNENERIPPVYSVGPILKPVTVSDGDLTESPRDPALSWLDKQPAGSVVFFCFGSKVGSFEKAQVEQLAAGIEKSGHRFLWSMRAPSDDVFPVGFLDRTAGVGKVIGWAPQVDVLGHVAVGAFVSHCGWNSVLESLWFGVPLVTWPMYAEQQLNAFVLVRELGLAVELKLDYKFDLDKMKGSVVVEAAEVEAAIRQVMEEEGGVAARKRTKEMSERAKKAVEVGGSSYVSLSRFLEDVKNIV